MVTENWSYVLKNNLILVTYYRSIVLTDGLTQRGQGERGFNLFKLEIFHTQMGWTEIESLLLKHNC